MANQRLELLYEQIFEYVYPEVKDLGRGVLYKVIHLILDIEHSNSENICNYFDIKSSNTIDDDQKIVDGLINKLPRIMFNPMFLLNTSRKTEIFWIVIVACGLVGVVSCFKYRDYKQQKTKQARDVQPISPETVVPALIPAALCLIIPAYIANNIREYRINTYEIEQLIDKASYFLCIQPAEADYLQQHLEFTNENISNVSEQQEVFIRIDIPNTQEMLGKTSTYILKRNLPSHGQGVVRQVACLRNLSGLEQFNRV